MSDEVVEFERGEAYYGYRFIPSMPPIDEITFTVPHGTRVEFAVDAPLWWYPRGPRDRAFPRVKRKNRWRRRAA